MQRSSSEAAAQAVPPTSDSGGSGPRDLRRPGPAGDRPPARWAHRPVIAFRVVSVLFTVNTLVQAALAGLFVNGDVGLLTAHDVNAHVLTMMLVAETAAATVAWRARANRVWPTVLGAVLLVLIVVQQIAGYSRNLLLHIPLGVALFGGACTMTVWAFTLTLPVRTLKALHR
ncbi:hypothetical protein SUDANB178_03413 [Streptomyces sp. enrichment culture]